MGTLKRRLLPFVAAGLLTLGIAMPVAAHPHGGPIVTGGLVNVTIVDVLNDNIVTVQVPLAAAINICDTDILAVTGGNSTCTAVAGSEANN